MVEQLFTATSETPDSTRRKTEQLFNEEKGADRKEGVSGQRGGMREQQRKEGKDQDGPPLQLSLITLPT